MVETICVHVGPTPCRFRWITSDLVGEAKCNDISLFFLKNFCSSRPTMLPVMLLLCDDTSNDFSCCYSGLRHIALL
jgi:hypothetical protein